MVSTDHLSGSFYVVISLRGSLAKKKTQNDLSVRVSHLRTFALIVYAHPYCARNSRRNAMLRHARARAQRKNSIHMKGW